MHYLLIIGKEGRHVGLLSTIDRDFAETIANLLTEGGFDVETKTTTSSFGATTA